MIIDEGLQYGFGYYNYNDALSLFFQTSYKPNAVYSWIKHLFWMIANIFLKHSWTGGALLYADAAEIRFHRDYVHDQKVRPHK